MEQELSLNCVNYKWEAKTLEGFIQQLAIAYVARGYFFYVSGAVPDRLTLPDHDTRLLKKFDVARSKWSRYRRSKRVGPNGAALGNVQYIRFGRFWVLLASHGCHKFFVEHSRERNALIVERQYLDIRETPIQFGGYSIGHKQKVSVRMNRRAYKELKTHFLYIALQSRKTHMLEREFRRSPFEPYGGVTRQMFAIRRAVNHMRKTAGLRLLTHDCVRTKRKSVRPFESDFKRLAA